VKFRVERDALGEAVAWVARALPARPVIPVLSGLHLEAAGAGLTLSCFDYEVSARVAVPAEIDEPGTALVPGRLLAEIARSLPPQLVEVSSSADMVRLACGSAEFELVSLPAEEYPGLPEPPAPAGSVDGGVLAAAAAQVVPSASRDDTLPMLTGVCLDVTGSAMTFAATDRYRLAVRTVDWTPAVPGLRAAALVPARTLADVARTMAPGVPVTIAFSVPDSGAGETGGPGQGSASQGSAGHGSAGRGSGSKGNSRGSGSSADEPRPAEGMISFEGGGRRLTARLIGGDFIRYRSRFPDEFGCRAELPAELFTAAVRRVSLVADRTSPVRLTFGHDAVVIEAHTDGRARAAESVRAAFTGTEHVISFSPAYLLDGLAAAAICGGARAPGSDGAGPEPEPGRIRLEFTSPAKPALITWAGYDIGPDPADDTDASPSQDADAASADQAAAESANADASEGSRSAGAETGSGNGEDGDETPAFRYLVVPLRTPSAGSATA
jgi:DNA polymerase III subunit beta